MDSHAKRQKISHNVNRHFVGGGISDLDGTLKEASKMAMASSFVLEAEELLKNVRLDHAEAYKGADKLLFKAKEVLDSLAEHGPKPIMEASRALEKKTKLVIPYPDPAPSSDCPYSLSFAKPSKVNVVGSYIFRSGIESSDAIPTVDMIVEMPASLFQEKDYQNLRYFYRRAYYLAYITSALRQCSEFGSEAEWSFEFLHENELLPVLLLRPSLAKEEDHAKENEDDGDSDEENSSDSDVESDANLAPYALRIIPCIAPGVFAKSKLEADRGGNKVGSTILPGGKSRSSISISDAASTDPSHSSKRTSFIPGEAHATPFYNSTLEAEETYGSYLNLLARAKKDCAGFINAWILGRIWLRQRGFGSALSQGGFGSFEWAILMALLLRTNGRRGKPILSSALSSTELFKATIQFLSAADITCKPVVLGSASLSKGQIDALRVEGKPCFLDVERSLDIGFKMSPWSGALLELHAKASYDALCVSRADQFSNTFIIKSGGSTVPFFDSVIDVEISGDVAAKPVLDRRGIALTFGLETYHILKKALAKRAKLVHISWENNCTSWSVTETPVLSASSVGLISVGILFEPMEMEKSLDLGPAAEDEDEAELYRQFWGEKSELRRFKDGSILECVPFKPGTAVEICLEIIEYILSLHLGLVPGNNVHLHDTGLSEFVELTPRDKVVFDMARNAFTTLETDLRGLEDLPLSIRRVVAIDSALRYASVDLPLPGQRSTPMGVLVFFEESHRWPDNLIAIQDMKVEFLLDLDKRLRGNISNVKTYLGRENVDLGIRNIAYLDIVYDSGYAFRMYVHSDLEEHLLQQRSKLKTISTAASEDAEQALLDHQWFYNTLPLHSQSIATYCTRLPALSSSIRVVKQWLSRHKLSLHLREELIELFVLHTFLEPNPFPLPTSAATGFFHTLQFLARWDWREEALIIDYDGQSISSSDRTDIKKTLELKRQQDPSMRNGAVFVITPHERTGLAYGRLDRAASGDPVAGPSRITATRLTHLARSSLKSLQSQPSCHNVSSIFTASNKDYDVTIQLSMKAIAQLTRGSTGPTAGQTQFKNIGASSFVPLPQHPTKAFLNTLTNLYEDVMVFFQGAADDNVIGAIWFPRRTKQSFRQGLSYNFITSKGAGKSQDGDPVELNTDAILAEIARIGGDLIKRIETK